MAQLIGTRSTSYGATETMYRLSVPLADCAPDWRNVFVQLRDNGDRHIHRAHGYVSNDGNWYSIPRGSWIACFQPLTARDLALVESEIAAVHGNWSA